MLEHGGQLIKAAEQFGIAEEEWLDLSTGINPRPWQITEPLPAHIWSQLPQNEDSLLISAKAYYQTENLIAVAGSQAAIQCLPRLRPTNKVAVLSPAYAEHQHAWQQAGHDVTAISSNQIDAIINDIDVLIIINPNNPSGEQFEQAQLLSWHNILANKQGWLIVDEAFIDTKPEQSMLPHTYKTGLIVLRSLGKFFGLAGLRVGFVSAEKPLLSKLAEHLGPWPIAHASRYIATKALADKEWQYTTRQQLAQQSQRLCQLLEAAGFSISGATDLFVWLKTEQADSIYQALAQQSILTRLFASPPSLRFGLPDTENDWQRLQSALRSLKADIAQ